MTLQTSVHSAQTRLGEAEVERFRGSAGHVGVHGLEAEEERGADGDAERSLRSGPCAAALQAWVTLAAYRYMSLLLHL